MGMFTFKIVKIEESGSIGRQLKASITANGVTTEFGFEGNTTKNHILLKDADIESKTLVVPVSIQVSEIDKKYPDGPFSGAGKYSVDPSKGDKLDYPPLPVPITEMGAKGKSKDKKAMLNFYFEANITCRGGKNKRTTSDEGIGFITANEGGIKNKAYKDKGGKWTIGIGHLIILPAEQNFLTNPITDNQAKALLRQDLATAENGVNSLVKVCLTQNQFDALVDFTFQEGRSRLARSALLKKINGTAAEKDIRAEFAKWIYVGTNISQNLVTRRQADADLYFTK